MLKETIENLKENGFAVIYCNAKSIAEDYIINLINPGDKVGIGGSMTIKSLKLDEKIIAKGGIILDHNVNDLNIDEKLEIMRQQLVSDIFLCSSNAVTEAGELINIDAVGNRVAAMTFGPKKVIIAIGVNKISKNEKEAFNRIEEVVAPKNNVRLNKNNPCTKTGYCTNCKSPSRICRVYSVIKRKPNFTDITILLIDEELGY